MSGKSEYPLGASIPTGDHVTVIGGTQSTGVVTKVQVDSAGKLDIAMRDGTASAAIRVQDSAMTSAVSLVVGGYKRKDTLTVDTSSNSDVNWAAVDHLGRFLVNDFGAPIGQSFQAVSAAATDTSSTLILAAGAAGIRHHVRCLVIANTSAVESAGVILDGASTICAFHAPANSTVVIPLLMPLKGTAATALNFQMATTATSTRVTAIGFSVTD